MPLKLPVISVPTKCGSLKCVCTACYEDYMSSMTDEISNNQQVTSAPFQQLQMHSMDYLHAMEIHNVSAFRQHS